MKKGQKALYEVLPRVGHDPRAAPGGGARGGGAVLRARSAGEVRAHARGACRAARGRYELIEDLIKGQVDHPLRALLLIYFACFVIPAPGEPVVNDLLDALRARGWQREVQHWLRGYTDHRPAPAPEVSVARLHADLSVVLVAL